MIVDCAVYEDGERRAGDLALAEAGEAAQRDGSFVWIGVFEPSAEEFDAVRREFDLHELAVEDASRHISGRRRSCTGTRCWSCSRPSARSRTATIS